MNTIALSQNELLNIFGVYGEINAERNMQVITPAKKDKRYKARVRVISDEKKTQLVF